MADFDATSLCTARDAVKQMLFDSQAIWKVCRSKYGHHNLTSMVSDLICSMNEYSWVFFNDDLWSCFRRVSQHPVQEADQVSPTAFELSCKLIYLTFETFDQAAKEYLVATDQLQDFPPPTWTFYIPRPALDKATECVVDDWGIYKFHTANVDVLLAQVDLDTDKAIRELPVDVATIPSKPDQVSDTSDGELEDDDSSIDLSAYTRQLTKTQLQKVLGCGKNEVNKNLREQFPDALISNKLLSSMTDEQLKGRHSIRLPIRKLNTVQRQIAGVPLE